MIQETIGRSRRLVVDALIFFLVGGSLFAIVRGTDWYWPFCTYPMYAVTERSPTLVSFRIEGIAADGKSVSLMGTPAIEPFTAARLNSALRALGPLKDRRRRALEDLLSRYNRRVRSGELAGPPFVRMRASLATWKLDRTALAPESAPDRQVLVAEVGAPPGS